MFSGKHSPWSFYRLPTLVSVLFICCGCSAATNHKKKTVLDDASVRQERAAFYAKRGYVFDPRLMTSSQMDHAAAWHWPEDWARIQEDRKRAALEKEQQLRVEAQLRKAAEQASLQPPVVDSAPTIIVPTRKPLPIIGP